MITRPQFNDLWDYLLANPWDFIDKERLPATKELFYNNLKNYEYSDVWRSFDNFIHKKDVRKLPLIQSIISDIEASISGSQYKNANPDVQKKNKSFSLLKSLVKETSEIINKYGNDKERLKACGKKYQKLSRS